MVASCLRSGLPSRYQKGKFLGKAGHRHASERSLKLGIDTFDAWMCRLHYLQFGCIFLFDFGIAVLLLVPSQGGFAKCYEVQDLESKEFFAARALFLEAHVSFCIFQQSKPCSAEAKIVSKASITKPRAHAKLRRGG